MYIFFFTNVSLCRSCWHIPEMKEIFKNLSPFLSLLLPPSLIAISAQTVPKRSSSSFRLSNNFFFPLRSESQFQFSGDYLFHVNLQNGWLLFVDLLAGNKERGQVNIFYASCHAPDCGSKQTKTIRRDFVHLNGTEPEQIESFTKTVKTAHTLTHVREN